MPKPYLRLDYDPDDGLVHGFIEFGGRAVNLNRMAEQEQLDYSYLWRVFNGFRVPSLPYAEKLAGLMGMSTSDFLRELDRLKKASAVTD